ncbi:hypothetical protein TNCT_509921 [Trichonephila clavata]|uniref:Uncharacterized protein n=1 Tax=Trichonephila clavata TaxID=2740835 RepID=A0A8X6IKQ1_TRICU|nr:hypothetical protein TNCT_509921 [Trichonephila clavata]
MKFFSKKWIRVFPNENRWVGGVEEIVTRPSLPHLEQRGVDDSGKINTSAVESSYQYPFNRSLLPAVLEVHFNRLLFQLKTKALRFRGRSFSCANVHFQSPLWLSD